MDQAENRAVSLPSILCLKEKVVKSTIMNNILMDALVTNRVEEDGD